MPLTGRVPARANRYKVPPTHCVLGCGHALTATLRKRHDYVCYRCRGRRAGRLPSYEGICTRCGQRPGGSRSAMCRTCNDTVADRHRRLRALLTAALGEAIPFDWLARFPDDPRAKAYTAKLIAALRDGHLFLSRKSMAPRRAA